jgi:signal transduction histidine kinase
MESRMVRSNGDLMWGRVSLRLLRERGQPLRFIPMVEDITDWVIAREQLQDSEAQLRSLASEAALAEERERRRLASELHDNLGHELALAAIHLDSVVHQLEPASSEHRGDLESVRESVARAITSVRSLTFDLSPPELYQLGLRAALDSLAHRLNQRSGLDVQVQETGKSRELDDDLLAFCYTAVRELLVNVVKHAGVDAATVHIRWLEGQLVLSVVDQGAGFDSGSDADGGFGLLSMRERAHQLGGEMILLAAPGEGTRVTLSIPTQYPAGAQLSGGPEASWSGS